MLHFKIVFQGAFGEVRLLVDSKNPGTMVAAKCMAARTTEVEEQEQLYKKLRREVDYLIIRNIRELLDEYFNMLHVIENEIQKCRKNNGSK